MPAAVSIANSPLIFLLLLLVPLTLVAQSCVAAAAGNDDTAAQNMLKYWTCQNSENSINGSSEEGYMYKMDRRQFLATIPSNAINNSGFYNNIVAAESTTTTTPTVVFGMAMCHADIRWPDQCRSCLQAAAAVAPKVCPSSKNATLLYQGCVLVYSDTPALNGDYANEDDVSSVVVTKVYHAARVPVTATTAFGQLRKELFDDLAVRAAQSPLRIASDNRTFNSTHKLYALAQCNREFEAKLCSDTISAVVDSIPVKVTDDQWSEGLSVTGYNYYIRYDLTPFGVYLPGTSSSGTAKGGLVHQEIVATLVAISIIFLLVGTIVMMHYHQKWEKSKREDILQLKEFSYSQIRKGTNRFNAKNKLGQGGFGQVFKGKFRVKEHEMYLAVKRVTNQDAAKHLKDELGTLATLHHKNVVGLKGYCIKGKKLFVCNEMLSGSLDEHLPDMETGHPNPINWQFRYGIIRGVCEGILYLHGDCSKNISHMDIKPSNILLDEKMMPKIADFGLSRVLDNKSYTITSKLIGSSGYMAPEFVDDGRVGYRCDIYSIGILIMVIVMGKGPTTSDTCGKNFIGKVREKFTGCTPEQLRRYAFLEDRDCIDDVKKCLVLAFDCVEEKPENRPSTKEICTRLNIVASNTSQVEAESESAIEVLICDPEENHEAIS